MENKVQGLVAAGVGWLAAPLKIGGTPLPPPISGIITLAGNSLQNPDFKELRY
jgi:hypothetical protein